MLPPAAERRPRGDRYDGQRAVFGQAVQDKLASTRAFLVGAGAIGCEVLKTWSLMGVACTDGGGTEVGERGETGAAAGAGTGAADKGKTKGSKSCSPSVGSKL